MCNDQYLKIAGQIVWSAVALMAVVAISLDLGQWGAARWSAGEMVLALVPAMLLAVAVVVAQWVAAHFGPTRNAGLIVALGSLLVLVGYAITVTLSQD